VTLVLADWIVDHLTKLEPVQGLYYFGVSTHVLVMAMAAGLMLLTFVPLGIAMRRDVVPRGPFVNVFEAMLLFLRDEVVRPLLGKEGDKYLPVVWTFFFFILYCNLLGLFPNPIPVPIEGEHHFVPIGPVAATGSYFVTGTLAAIAFLWYHGLGVKEQGAVAYMRHICPGGVPLILRPFIWFLEAISHFLKAAALCIRLWANMLGGHAVLFAFIGFIFTYGFFIAPVAVVGGVVIFFLELFVAFLQAFVFTFLVVIFLSGALHPH
jgi:F-type H+-transporting ATPase subunit a